MQMGKWVILYIGVDYNWWDIEVDSVEIVEMAF